MSGPELHTVAVCGAGAVGGSYVERLQDLDPAGVVVVARGARRERLLREGLTVNGRRFAVRCVEPAPGAAPVDLLLVGVKQPHLAEAIADAGPLVGERTVVISLLNGVASEGALARAFGAEKVLPAFVIGNDVVREGTRISYTRFGTLVFGAPSNDPADPRVVAVRALLERAGIPCRVPEDILREQWWKFMLNVGVNQVSAVLRAPYRAFREVPEVRELTRQAALEAVAVARAEGVALGPEDVESIFPIVATLGPGGRTSMLQDVEAGRKTEVELFAGTVVELGARHGLPTPVNALLGTLLRALERMAGAA
ncbi:ketopantoate reductase family protein [Anaeromyxobacter paludicola]|uniref:ketopantoate reductase family protein n=1 Tax=Anaeromyxobacter paludicola TaxID=2918171 RepID=UPI0020C03035|nr:2-dehydropantoate 2-reductase [Anaeromyxobacter paludicola]